MAAKKNRPAGRKPDKETYAGYGGADGIYRSKKAKTGRVGSDESVGKAQTFKALFQTQSKTKHKSGNF